jgi:Squalene-hopene cyclase C-terminal domain
VLFLGLYLSQIAHADEKALAPPATTQQVHQTVERAIGYLQTESAAWLKTRQCAACHHVPMPLWALSEADQRGYKIDKKFLADTTEATLGSMKKMIASKIFANPAEPPDPRPQGKALNVGTAFLAIAARSLPALAEGQKQSLSMIAAEIVKKQQKDGSWEYFENRTPIHESQTTDAVWIILALQGETGPDATQTQRVTLEKANAWLAVAKLPDSHQGKVLKVLLAIRTGQPRSGLQAALDELFTLQQPDGGWRQTADRPSDAYATGQTLYVLALAGYTAERAEIKRAIAFLVATQKPDGSWPMTSRSTINGKPTKLLTPITCAASAWATLGLVRLMPK